MIEEFGPVLLARGPEGTERHPFSTVAEAHARALFINEAFSWIGTPFVDHAAVKGPGGAVDCAMLLTRCAIDAGLVAPFDPRPYPPRWHVHRDEERFVNFLTDRLGAREVEVPRIGDIGVWKFGRTYSHGGVLVSRSEIVHAWYAARMVIRTGIGEPRLAHETHGEPRPVRWFDLLSVREAGAA